MRRDRGNGDRRGMRRRVDSVRHRIGHPFYGEIVVRRQLTGDDPLAKQIEELGPSLRLPAVELQRAQQGLEGEIGTYRGRRGGQSAEIEPIESISIRHQERELRLRWLQCREQRCGFGHHRERIDEGRELGRIDALGLCANRAIVAASSGNAPVPSSTGVTTLEVTSVAAARA